MNSALIYLDSPIIPQLNSRQKVGLPIFLAMWAFAGLVFVPQLWAGSFVLILAFFFVAPWIVPFLAIATVIYWFVTHEPKEYKRNGALGYCHDQFMAMAKKKW